MIPRLVRLTAGLSFSLLMMASGARAREIRLWPLFDYRSQIAGQHSLDLLGPLLSWRSHRQHDELVVRPLFSYVRDGDDRRLAVLYPVFDLHWNEAGTEVRVLGLGAIDRYRDAEKRGWSDRVRLPPLLFYRGGGKQPASFALFPLYANLHQLFGQKHIRAALFPLYFTVDDDEVQQTWFAFPFLAIVRGEQAGGFSVWPLAGWQKRGREHWRYALWPLYARSVERDTTGQLAKHLSIRPFYSRSDSPTLHARLYLGFGHSVDRSAGYERWDFPWPLWHRRRSIPVRELDDLNLRPFYVRSRTPTVSTGSVLWPLYRWQEQKVDGYSYTSRGVLWRIWRWQRERGPETDEARLHTLFPLFAERHHGERSRLVVPAFLDALFPESRRVEQLYGPLWRLYAEKRRGKQRSWSMLWGLLGHDGRRMHYPLAWSWERRT